ncbi:MAG TPA: threonine synthase [Actinomycetota bacterium]|nr:threonine synthase [Actinomycetota bacterium]
MCRDFGITGLACRECGREHPIAPEHCCRFCFGPLEVVYDYGEIKKNVSREAIAAGPPSIWRYSALLPSPAAHRVDLGAGWTRLREAPRLAAELGLKKLWLKNDALNPTHSFKDRVVSVALTAARAFGFETVACASTGNLANSVAGHATATGLRSVVLIPAGLERGKRLATAIYGGTLIEIDGSYDDVNRLCAELASERPWAFVNVNLRPFYAEGSKTVAFEIAEQLDWRAPDAVVCPVASGALLTKIDRGFKELDSVGLMREHKPKIFGGQAEGCSPVAKAFRDGSEDVTPVKPDTVARSLAIGNPADGYYALRAVRASGGAVTAVPEPAVAEGIRLLARTEGLFTESAGGVTISALEQLVRDRRIDPGEETVAVITGLGLKTLEVVEQRFAEAIPASLGAVNERLEGGLV